MYQPSKTIRFLKKTIRLAKKISTSSPSYRPTLRIVNIEQDEHDDYEITIQLIGKNSCFKGKPEKILANDKMVDQFSPRDIRTLTYLGYLGINSPKYKILAKKLSEKNDQMVFAILEKGEAKPTIKTADEISANEDIIKNLNQKDAHMIGFTTATEKPAIEKKQKAEALSRLAKKADTHK